MAIYDESKMLQKDVYATERTPSYADWALFNMGKELEEKLPSTTSRDIRSIRINIIGGTNPLREPFDLRGGYTQNITIPIEEMAHLLPKGYRFMDNAPISCVDIYHIRTMLLCAEITTTQLLLRIQNWYSAGARVSSLVISTFIVKDN